MSCHNWFLTIIMFINFFYYQVITITILSSTNSWWSSTPITSHKTDHIVGHTQCRWIYKYQYYTPPYPYIDNNFTTIWCNAILTNIIVTYYRHHSYHLEQIASWLVCIFFQSSIYLREFADGMLRFGVDGTLWCRWYGMVWCRWHGMVRWVCRCKQQLMSFMAKSFSQLEHIGFSYEWSLWKKFLIKTLCVSYELVDIKRSRKTK